MSTINTNVADYLTQIETLTNTNLQILKSLNDAFFTKKNHLFTKIDEVSYVIPSFLSLENKINMLQENFDNLVHAPETGEAYFNFDGNTRAIEVRKYNHVPDAVKLSNGHNTISKFNVESNDIFKDFLTPVPYINFDLPELPNDIVEVNVKKIIARSAAIKNLFKNKLTYDRNETDASGKETIVKDQYISSNFDYSTIKKELYNYVEDVDYIEYDTMYKMPIRKNIGTATYVIEKVVDDIITEDLEEFVTLKLRNDINDATITNKLTYKIFDEMLEKQLQVGDELVNYDGSGKVVITEVKPIINTITVKIVNGEHLNFLGTDSYDTNNDADIHDFSKLRFYAAVDFDVDKYVKVPLEEDQYVFIAIAAVNSRMNLQSSWGTGILIDTYKLTNSSKTFDIYYKENVKNIGDVLFEMTSMITSPITALSETEFNNITTIKPVIDTKNLSVLQINNHLNNSTTIKNIRDAYNQKKTGELELENIQSQINAINTQLATISFDDTTGTRNLYLSQLNQLNTRKNEVIMGINTAIDTISLNVNASEIPIENAKHRIRGFYIPETDSNLAEDLRSHVIGIQVQYRYKNASSELGNISSIGTQYIYSDWNLLNTFNKSKIATIKDGFYKYSYEADNANENSPSYNQIDIPISQGETVDIRLKVVYDFGQPYITTTSDWSDIVNMKFPDELAKDVPILTIIEENNNDIETNRFNDILETSGTSSHVNDSIVDQNITYYHKPENIASGFYTDERRIIPLKDKLVSLSNDIATIKSEVFDTSTNCRVSISVGDDETLLYSDKDNTIILKDYDTISKDTKSDGVYEYGKDGSVEDVVSVMLNISIANDGESALKLYSIFPGPRSKFLQDSKYDITRIEDYITGKKSDADTGPGTTGIYFDYKNRGEDEPLMQGLNQFIMFRTKDVWTGDEYYADNDPSLHKDNAEYITDNITNTDMRVYPYLDTKYGLCMDNDNVKTYITINPGEEIVVPIFCKYKLNDTEPKQLSRTISFDLRTSLYSDLINYSFDVVCKKTNTVQDKLSIINKKRLWDRIANRIKYNLTVK